MQERAAAQASRIAELEAELTAWRAADGAAAAGGEGRAALAEAFSRLEVENTRLVSMLEDSQELLESQVPRDMFTCCASAQAIRPM
jgi:hypothetical protein